MNPGMRDSRRQIIHTIQHKPNTSQPKMMIPYFQSSLSKFAEKTERTEKDKWDNREQRKEIMEIKRTLHS
jgi:hypothetical protein